MSARKAIPVPEPAIGRWYRRANGQLFEVVAVDASPSMLEKAREEPVPTNLRFVEGDLAGLGELVDGRFGGAVCLGNTLPHLASREALDGLFRVLGEEERRIREDPAARTTALLKEVFE